MSAVVSSYYSDEQLMAEIEAESAIRDILLKLEEVTGRRVDWVRVDTRNFAGCNVEIAMTDDRAKQER